MNECLVSLIRAINYINVNYLCWHIIFSLSRSRAFLVTSRPFLPLCQCAWVWFFTLFYLFKSKWNVLFIKFSLQNIFEKINKMWKKIIICERMCSDDIFNFVLMSCNLLFLKILYVFGNLTISIRIKIKRKKFNII